MTREEKFPKWAELQARHQAQLERLEKAKKQRQEAGRIVTTQQHIYKLHKMAHT